MKSVAYAPIYATRAAPSAASTRSIIASVAPTNASGAPKNAGGWQALRCNAERAGMSTDNAVLALGYSNNSFRFGRKTGVSEAIG